MKTKLLLAVIIFSFFTNQIYSQQYCIPGRFDTTYVFLPSLIDTLGSVTYGRNTNWQGDSVNLKFIISYPKLAVDPLPKKPFILLMHGGGFYFGDKYDLKPLMLDFTLRGYVCASIDYRIGWNTGGDPTTCMGDGYSLAKAIYRAMQDAKAAFRYFKANANLYGIDTNYMFSGGLSAGAVTSLMIAFSTQQDVNSYYPTLYQELGSLDSSTNNIRNNFKLKSVLSASGGLFDTSFIKLTNAIPTIMFHGTSDIVVPYGTGFAYSCSNYVRTEGSGEMKKRFRSLVKTFELDYVPGGGHENYYPVEYIQLRTIKFLKRVLCNQAKQIIIENYTTILDTTLGSITNVYSQNENIPSGYKLFQNYPNPFNPSTIIRYQIPKNGLVILKVYDIIGREVATLVNELLNAGIYETQFSINSISNNQLSSGIYFYKLTAGDFTDIKRMVLIK